MHDDHEIHTDSDQHPDQNTGRARKRTRKTPRANTTDLLTIGGKDIALGETAQIQLPVAKLYTDTEMAMPIHVVRGKKSGPIVFVCAAIHGDELNGIEIIRRLLQKNSLKLRKGTFIAVPIVNVYGVLSNERYMPDRRDLNRSFPGSKNGSLARRIAYQFMHEVVSKCDYGIDLHTGAIHRSNLPQVRADLSDPVVSELAKAFGVPVLIDAHLRDGSLRKEAADVNTKVLLYEAGEALRFDELSIRAGVNGVMHILAHLGMLVRTRTPHPIQPFVADKSAWVRATGSGIVTNKKKLGAYIKKGDELASIGNHYGEEICKVISTKNGILIGQQNIPLVQEGDAMFHIAYFDESDNVDAHIDLFEGHIMPEED